MSRSMQVRPGERRYVASAPNLEAGIVHPTMSTLQASSFTDQDSLAPCSSVGYITLKITTEIRAPEPAESRAQNFFIASSPRHTLHS